jgi:hypothetical protein
MAGWWSKLWRVGYPRRGTPPRALGDTGEHGWKATLLIVREKERWRPDGTIRMQDASDLQMPQPGWISYRLADGTGGSTVVFERLHEDAQLVELQEHGEYGPLR